ncbi:Phosphoribosylformylglycinamidine synthase subunit PurS [Sulfuracidifex tepidarius]|uniref:Phosphoribosylformylglycinamidine synthase subunit PurS n=1 Tax=Sulfuracidifex tepidarius TaxID=1294262 RepID=A0A510E2R9_9CREN|nr:phosphoribosylformylglycinamidine synthase subunit PurS [Sulfuracidifex tepidarius]BBG26803.1 Phosphoribosylformylglycinamidine synthase subunit PurS [Sulfuracidifex tepidarius]
MELIIKTKTEVRDPEGESIKMYAVNKVDSNVADVRAGKYLLFKLEADTCENALNRVKEIAEKARLYNPIIQEIQVRLS